MAQIIFIISLALASSVLSVAQGVSPSRDTVVIDARQVAQAPGPLPFRVGGTSPAGHTLGANGRYLIRDGRPWFPIMGEFHYTRYPAAQWEEEILKMKAGGIQVISTYVFWIHHEEIEGQFDWSDQRNLRQFVQLCAKHGLYVWVRIGPWAHGEVRNGGLPDWLLLKTATRENDPVYLHYVTRFYGAIAEQVKGLLWKDGGPIIGVQLENEYNARGPGKGAEHILRLRQLARDAGLDVPFYTVTGWDNAVIPPTGVLPVFSGYADGFWWRTASQLPPNPNYFFTKIRCQENVAENLTSLHPEIEELDSRYPFLTSEMGGGMEVAYHRRPLMSADDTAAMELVKLGSGVAMYGYYMFHGGTNPDGKRTTLQESQATGYPNDLPIKSYDFQAPLGEFGEARPSFGVLKLFHLFLGDFGSELATMIPYFPERSPISMHDVSTPRVSARLDHDHGFIFINNYQRTYPLPEHKNFQVKLKLPAGEIDVPRRPLTLPSGSYTFWPVNLRLGGSVLRYATAQLLCRLEDANTYFFFAIPGIPAEFAIAPGDGEVVEAPGAQIEKDAGLVYVSGIRLGTAVAIRLRRSGHDPLNIVVLTDAEARNAWKLNLDGKERLVLSSAQLYTGRDELFLQSTHPSELSARFFPNLENPGDGFIHAGQDGVFHEYSARVEPLNLTPKITKISDAGLDPPLKFHNEVPLMPEESAFESAAKWQIQVPHIRSNSIHDVFLKITYQGDLARIYSGAKLVTDNFYDGEPWTIGLSRIKPELLAGPLELRILPLQANAPIYLPIGANRANLPDRPIAEVKDVQLKPAYRVSIRMTK